jgi:hypothetical protein
MSEPRRTLLLILVPMWLTFAGMRLWLHLINRHTEVVLFGHDIHHLYSGAVVLLAATFMASFGLPARRWRHLTPILQGVGGAMVLDQIVFLIATDGTNDSYVLPLSFWGGMAFMLSASVFLAALTTCARRAADRTGDLPVKA